MEDKRKALYDALSGEYNLGTYEDFTTKLNDENKRRALYDAAGQDYNLGTYEEYSTKLGFGPSGTDVVPMFDDEPQVQEQPQAERGFAAGARESWKGLKAGFQNLWGETANVFTGSSQDSINALNELNDMVRQGKDVAAETEDAWTDFGRELRTGTMEFLPGWMIKGWKDRVADKAEKQKVLSDIRDVLGETGGDVDKARTLLEQRAQDQSYGDLQMEKAAEKFADIKPTEGFGAWVGSNAVQMVPSASALIVGAVTKSPAAAKAIGMIGMGGMTASTAGTSMYEAREAGASDSKTWKVGVTDGMIEYLTEKLPFDRYTSRIMGKVKSEVAQDLFSALRTNKATRTELENLLIKANDRLGGKLFSKKNLKDYVADMLAEGASEFSAEALQTMTSMMYEEPENYPTINEILTNGWEGAKAGFFMGAVLGGASKTMEHSQNRQRRMDKGSVDIALVDMGNGEKDVAEVVEYDAKSNTAVILRDGALESVSGSAISDGYRFSFDEFEKARLRQMEDEAIVSGNVNDGQIQGLEDNISRDIEEIRALAPEITENGISAILQSEISVEPDTPLGDAVAKYQEDVARYDELVAAKREADAAKKEAIRTEIETAVGQRFWVQESGEDDISGIVPVSETVEEVVYADGRVGYVVGSDESGNLTMVYTDGTKGFSSRAEITKKENSGEILSNTVMGLDDYLAVKMDIEEVTREKARMQEEHALSVEEMIANHPQGSVINVGTEEFKIEVPIIAPPTTDGVIVQMPDGTTPMLTWEDVAHAEKKEITPKTDAQINQSIVDEYRVAYTPVNPIEAAVPIQQKEEQVKMTSPANPLPLKADGTVDQTALWNKDPERWAQWNDEQRQDGGANSLAYVSGAIAKEQAKIAELQAAYGAEADFDARDVIEKEIADTQARVERLTAIQQGYLAQPAEEQRRQPLRERAKELSKKLGVKVNIAEGMSDVKEAMAREEILRAEVSGGKQTVAGWFNPTTGEVTIYLPHAKDTTDVEQTFVHEVVAHKGIRGLLGEEGFNVLCDAVWDMMTEDERAKYMAYPGVNGDKRAAADEYIAHYAETMNLEESKPVWDRIMDLIMRILNSMGVNLEMTKDQLSDIIVASYQKLVKEAEANAESEVATEEAQATPIVSEEQLNAPNSGEAQQITATDGEVLADTDGKGGVRFSIRTWNEGGRDYLAAWLANDTTLTEEEKADILARMDEFYKNALLYSDTYVPFGTWSDAGVRYDNNGNPLMSVIKANGDYAMNLDFSLVCKKRRPLNRLLRTLVNRNAFATYTLRERELAEINWILQEHGFEVACALCFVDSKRYRVTGVADVFAALYNRLVKSLAPEGVQIAHFNYNNNPNVEVVENGLDTISDDQLNWNRFDRLLSAYKKGSVEYKVAQYLREHHEARKLVDATDFIEAEGFESVKENNPDLLKFYNMKKGTGGPKASFGDVQYLNDILKKEKSFDAEKAYAVGGVRLQSFSDFVPHMYFDYMQLFAELAAKKLPLHAYTKEVLFAKIFGLTGAKINMSLVPAVVEGGIAPGLDAQGNYAWADPVTDAEGNVIQQGQSFPYDEAMAIQQAEGYSKNCGVIAVGISDAHIEKMLDDPNIPFIIPYHKSSLNAIVARMNNIDQYKDYTNVQNTRKASGSKLDKGTKDFNFNEHLHGLGESGTPQQAAQAYLDWCRENKFIPKFSQFAYHPNYYKLLQDFNTIDLVTGEYAPQGAVTMTFPTEQSAFGNVETLIQQGLQEDAELEEKMEQEIDGIADQVLARLEEISKEPKMSEKQQAKKMAELADERMSKIKAKAQGPIDLIEEARKAIARENAKKNKKAKKSEVRFRTTEIIPEVREEMAKIKESAERNGTYLKAPNGQPTNLTPEQWMMVRTEGFKFWFGDWEKDPENASKVIDINGEPMVVYHGTQSKFTAFDVGYKGKNFGFRLSDGFYFSPDEVVAESYASFPDELKTGEVKAVFLNITEPFYIKSAKDYREQIKEIVSLAARGNRYQADLVAGMPESELLSQRGYDGVVEKRADEITGEIVVFNPNQIKSATDNAGVFSVYDDIRFRAVTPEMDAEYMKAVKSGDLDTAQRMVDETADRVMKNSKVRDSQGKLIRVTHYSPNEFTTFDPQKIGSSTDWGVFGRGFYFSNKDHRLYGKNRYEGYLNLENPFIINGAEEAYAYKEAIADFAGVQYYEVGKKETDEYTDYLISQGYDGVIYNDTFSGFNEYVAFYPYQFKLADVVDVETKDDNGNLIPLSERFNPEKDDIRFRAANDNQAIFVSNAAKAVEGIKQEKATPEQWLKMIEKNGGLKAGEDKWMGLSDWLKDSDKKTLTKQEVLDFVNENMIQIEEVHYAAGAEDDAENTYAMIERILQEKFGKYIAEYYEQNSGEDDDLYGGDSYEYAMDKLREEMNDEFPYAIERSNSVVYLTFPYEETDDLQEWADKLGVTFAPQNPINDTRLSYTTDGLSNKHEIALTVPAIEPWNETDEIHFGDAGDGRAVAWIRFGETWERRPSPQISRKVLVIDEIQSKRHQEGREKGYTTKEDVAQRKAAIAGAKKATNDLYDYIGELVAKYPGTEYSLERVRENRGRFTEEENNKLTLLIMEHNYAELELEKHRGEGVPDAPFDKNWYELAMKRMLRYAAENGYDVIAWTTGDQQNQRYGLSKVVDEIYVDEDFASTKREESSFRMILKNGDNNHVGVNKKTGIVTFYNEQPQAIGRPLSELLGKELAEKILAARDYQTFREVDFELSEGMKGFYDRMLPAFMNKYGKKWGVKVEDIELPNLENGLTMHSVPVTEEMKASVMEGQVMFRVRREDETPMEFTQQAVDEFATRYTDVDPTYVINEITTKKALADALNLYEDQISDEQFTAIKKGFDSDGVSCYMEDWDRILIFAKSNRTEAIENTLFHESIHKLDAKDITGGDVLGQWLWDNAEQIQDLPRFKKNIEDSQTYGEDEYAGEMLAESLSWYMSIGETGILMSQLPQELKQVYKSILNELRYESRTEDARRQQPETSYSRARRAFRGNAKKDGSKRDDAQSRQTSKEQGVNAIGYDTERETRVRSGNARRGVAGNVVRNTSVEQSAARKKRREGELTAEERRIIGEYFPEFNKSEGVRMRANSQGKELTDGQKEFFANSKAVDKDGNLLVLYHGTPRAGFTEFKSGWFTTSKKDAISYSGDRKGRMFDPTEQYEPETLTAGDFRLGYMTFDSEEDRAAFLAEYLDAETAMSEAEFDSMTLQADEEYDDLITRKPELQKIWNAYREYERERFIDATIGDIISNPEAYTEEDLMRAMLAYDSNANFDSLEDMDASERKDTLVSALQNANEEAEGGILDMVVPTRVPRNGEGQKHNDLGNRTYEVYANVENPYEIDANGRGSEFESGDIYKLVEEALADEQYDGVIIRNWRVGRHQQLGDVVVPKNGSQIKLTSNENPTESGDVRYRISDVNTNPTEAQKKAGNYKMGHIRLDGYNITIENPKGSVRRGTDSKGNAWENTLNNDYGYIRGTEGVDGDHIDVYLSDNPTEGNVFVIDQVNPETRKFDEHKVMYGFNSAEEAREAYLANFSEGWNGLGTITEVSKDEFKKWIESSHRKTKPFSEYVRANEMQATDESELRYRVVSDQETLDRLNSEPTIKVYRAMQLIDGKLYPPMSAKVDGELRQPIELGQWEEAEERPDLVDEKGRFKLDKGNKSSLKARYNPYFHTSPTPLNDQFSSAQTRPELVTVEVEVPESELTSGYKAEKAKDSVGKLEWKAGVVQSKLSGTRTVILSRWDKPVRIVPDSEVADVIVDMFEGKDITMPSNVVTPSLRAELEKRGVPFVETDNQGNPVEEVSFRVTGTSTDEVVANGFQLTPAQTAEVAASIFTALPEESRKKITEGLNGNILGLQDAILQVPTSLATKENWNDKDRQMANAVAEEMTKMAGEMTRPFSAPEALWLLYNNLNKDTDLISQASRALVQRNLGFDAETLAKQEQAKEGVRFRTVGDATSNAQASLYNKGAVNVWTRLKESFVDMQASVEELVKAIEKRTGAIAQGFENVLLALNQQPPKGFAAMESYTQMFLNPMFDEIRRIMNATDFKYEDIVRYVILKHGLERNKKLAQRDAKAHYQEIYDDIISKISGMTAAQKRTYLTNAQLKEADAKAELATLKAVDMSAMTDEEKREHKKKLAVARKAVEEAEEHLRRAQKIASMSEQEAKDELDKVFEKIENGTDSVYKEMRENDYSGISSMFYDQLGVDRKNFSTEEQYQAALMEAKKDKYSSLADVEAAAEAEVRVFEGLVDTKELWKRINACTKETLRQQYEANMISKDQYENLRNMFEYYVPLRGFKDNTAEDMYTYYRKPNSTGYTKPILGAEGRKTEAKSPFGWIASMAGSAIASNVKNEAKLALYYFVSNRPNNGIATISRTWFVDSGEVDERGKKIFKPAYPPFSEDLSSDEAKARYESWQENMRELQKKGQAYEAGQRLNLGNAVVNISDANKPEHIVNVKVGGKDYTIIINGNPRAAQAINGDLNIEGTSQDYSALFGPVLRWMSSVNTSYNPEFWITNMMRDMAFTMMAVNIKEDPAYRRKFSKNYLKAFKVVSLVAKNENGTIGDSYLEQQYKDFVKYGGVTGYTQIKDSETWEKEIENYLSSNDPESIKSGKVMRGMKTAFHAAHRFGESLEQVSRFAAFLTARETGKSINEAINDAKEITVNFNRKGSGKWISFEEAKSLTGKNGQPLTKPQQWMVVGLSSIAPLGRRFIMFFNAAIQGLNATYKLMKKNPKRFTGWALGYAAVGMMNALLHAMMDDDDDYLDIPQYERRNSLMIGGNGAYFKWALPQEARAFYALGDLAVETVMGRNPHQNFLGEALKIGTEILPVNPSEGWKAFIPSIAIPAIELMLNEDYKGSPIYNDQKWLSEEEKERTAKWSKAYQGTGWMYVKIAQGLNFVTGGDEHDAGLINLQPEKMEHLVQSAFGGTIRTADKFINTISAVIDPDEPWTVRQTPFLNRFLTINDERFKNVHVNDVFDYYKADAEHALTLEKQYIKDRDMDSLTKLRSSDEYQWAKIYGKYKKPLKAIQEKIKVADGTAEKKELMKQQDELKKKMIKEISEL